MTGMKRNRVQARPRRQAFPEWVVWVVAGAFTLAALISGLLVFNSVRNLVSSLSGGGGLPSFRAVATQSSAGTPNPHATPTAVQLADQPIPWNGTDRVTILLMGLDYRDWEAGNGPPRTDSMMLVSIDPVSKSVGILSIPRDLWVDIPGGFDHNRINTAYFLGESYNLPGGGPALAMKTVENLLGVPIQYYAVIEFNAFEKMIDEIGGIDVLVTERIKISPLGRLSHWLDAKAYHLDGPDALAYARARKTEGGDFDRAQRQQQVALAVRDSILNVDMVPTLVAKAPVLYQEVALGIHSNLTLDQMVSLGLLLVQIPKQNILRDVIAPPNMVTLETQPDGAQVLKPVPDQIRLLRDKLFTQTGAIAPSVSLDNPVVAAVDEKATISVRNGAGVEGLATRTAEYLTQQGLNVTEATNADRLDYGKSRLLVYKETFPYTVRYLAGLMNISESQILVQNDPQATVDMAVILGSDWIVP
jgi:LCP family protein required for cell wall assembly